MWGIDQKFGSSLDFKKLNLLFQKWEEAWVESELPPSRVLKVSGSHLLPKNSAPNTATQPEAPNSRLMSPSAFNSTLKSAEN